MRALGEMRGRRQPMPRLARRLAWVGVPLVVLGELGHHLLERLGTAVAHHLFHIAFGAGAVAVFGLYVAAQIRRHGWPSFSWRLAPKSDSGSAITRRA